MRHLRRAVLGFAVVVLAAGLAGCWRGGGAARSHARGPAQPGKIALESDGIWVMNPDGSGKTRIVNRSAWSMSWSPDGKRLAFISGDSGERAVYVVNADGTDLRRLALDHPADPDFGLWDADSPPRWSPSGDRIAFTRWEESAGAPQQIWVIAPDGTSAARLTSGRWDSIMPAWSPDGSRIAFVSSTGQRSCIFLMNAEGSGMRQLSHASKEEQDSPRLRKSPGPRLTPLFDSGPAWSPDGRRIAFHKGFGGIWLLNPDSGQGGPLKGSDHGDASPAWSPDGETIVCDGHGREFGERHAEWSVGGDLDIFTIDVASGRRCKLTVNADDDIWPVWSPDGRQIAFISVRDGSYRAYVMNSDGTGQANLSRTLSTLFLAWGRAAPRPPRKR
jgi:Tol biopolymer transport system component